MQERLEKTEIFRRGVGAGPWKPQPWHGEDLGPEGPVFVPHLEDKTCNMETGYANRTQLCIALKNS